MIETLKNNFVEFLVMSTFCLGIVCLTFGTAYNNKLEKQQELEMAKLGCSQKFGPAGYHVWECPSKDK